MAASPNDTVIMAGDGHSITDGNGNVWTIVNGQVEVNGQPDNTTSGVIEMAFVDGNIWQENNADLWWMKTKPSDTWSPGPGTSMSPLPTSMNSPSTDIFVVAPTSATVQQGQATPISGVSISAPAVDGFIPYSVTLSDSNGALAVQPSSGTMQALTPSPQSPMAGAKVTLTVSGTIASINAALATLTDTDNSTSPDTIHITAVNQGADDGVTTTASTAVTVTPSKPSAPVINAPSTLTVEAGQPTAVPGVSVTENSTPGQISVSVQDTNGVLGVGAVGSGVTTAMPMPSVLELAGPLDQVNAALAGLTVTDSVSGSDSIGINANDSLNGPASTQSINVSVQLPNPPFPPPSTPANFTITDESDNPTVTDTSAGQPYNGPVAGLSSQLIDITPDKLNITADVPNVFIHSGSGEDALNVAATGGTNVLDGSTGSNFLVGGSGDDTFFVDDRVNAPTTPPGGTGIWSTVVGFHSGDSVTVWGVTPQDFNVTTADNMGTAGFTGLTWDFAGGGTDAKLTLAGYSSANLSSLNVSFGTTAPTDGLPAANYMLIQG